MVLGWAAGIVIAMFVILILVRVFFKTAFKIISIIWLVVFLASIAFAILIYADVKDMREKCQEMPAVMLLADGENVLAGVQMEFSGDEGGLSSGDAFIGNLKKYQSAYESEDFSELRGVEHCRIAIFNISAFEGIGNATIADSVEIPSEAVIRALKSDDPESELIGEGVSVEGGDFTKSQLKGVMFAALFAKALDEKGPGFVIENFNNGRIRMAKETITFRMLRFMPKSFIDEIADKVAGTIPEEGEG